MTLRESMRSWWANLDRAERHDITPNQAWMTGQDWYGPTVAAGVQVTEDLALALSVVWRCIRLLSQPIAALPAEAVRARGPIREMVDRQPTWMSTPNPEQVWYQFAERVFESLAMDGNAFVLITGRDAQGFPSELWTLSPREIDVKVNASSRTTYVWGGSTELSRFGPDNPAGDLLHICGPTAGGRRGLSPIMAARQSVGLGLAQDRNAARFFGTGQQLSGVIELPAGTPPQTAAAVEQIRSDWMAAHSGPNQSHRPGILSGGATWKAISVTPEEAQFLQSRAYQVEDIASRIYGVPPHMVGLTEKATSWGPGIEAQSIGFVRFTLLPIIVLAEQTLSQLLPRGQFVRLNQRGLVRADSAVESEVLTRYLLNGVLSRNEVRALLDEPPVPGGDRYMVPVNEQVLSAGGAAVVQPSNGQVPAPTPAGGGA